jgi:hypothetical protein
MARQLEQWTDATAASEPEILTLLLQKLPTPFPLEWYKSNPRLAMDRFVKFDDNPESTPYYDKGDL